MKHNTKEVIMIIEDLKGMNLTHVKFGEGEVTDVIIDYSDMQKTKIEVQFEDRLSKFKIQNLDKYFIDLPGDLLDDINDRVNTHKDSPKIAVPTPKVELTSYNKDSFGNELNKGAWEDIKEYATYYWWSSNMTPAPVIMDNKTVFDSAETACMYLDINPNSYSVIYNVCNGEAGRQTYGGHKWKFAHKEDIESIIEGMINEE
jgi:hypothetical protein